MVVGVGRSGPYAARREDAVWHDEVLREVAGQHLSEICIESLHLLRGQGRTNTVAGADPAVPRFVTERDVDQVAEALDLGETPVIEGSYVLRVDAIPPGLRSSLVVLQHQLLRAVRDVAGERQIAKRADDQATARSEDASASLMASCSLNHHQHWPALTRSKLSATCPVSSARPSTK